MKYCQEEKKKRMRNLVVQHASRMQTLNSKVFLLTDSDVGLKVMVTHSIDQTTSILSLTN